MQQMYCISKWHDNFKNKSVLDIQCHIVQAHIFSDKFIYSFQLKFQKKIVNVVVDSLHISTLSLQQGFFLTTLSNHILSTVDTDSKCGKIGQNWWLCASIMIQIKKHFPWTNFIQYILNVYCDVSDDISFHFQVLGIKQNSDWKFIWSRIVLIFFLIWCMIFYYL